MSMRLFTPGPVAVPPDVQQALAGAMPHHRTPEFETRFRRVLEMLGRIFRTTDPVVVLTASGTGAMEAAVVNLTQPGERVVSANGGKFGARWGELLRTYGRDVHERKLAWGEPYTPEQFDADLEASGARIAFVTHSETSTGVLCDLQQIARIARRRDVVLVVDAITSVGAHRLETQAWGLDAVIGGSQKAFMMPPGLAFLSLSERAQRRLRENPTPRYYFDLVRALRAAERGQSPWTPAISLVLALEAACDRILAEGLEQVWRRHQVLADAVRAGVAAMGLAMPVARPSNAVTVVAIPEAVGADAVRNTLWERFRIKVAGGQDDWRGRVIRIGHLGAYDAADVLLVLEALEGALQHHGHPVATGAAGGAARPVLAELF